MDSFVEQHLTDFPVVDDTDFSGLSFIYEEEKVYPVADNGEYVEISEKELSPGIHDNIEEEEVSPVAEVVNCWYESCACLMKLSKMQGVSAFEILI